MIENLRNNYRTSTGSCHYDFREAKTVTWDLMINDIMFHQDSKKTAAKYEWAAL